MDIRPSNSEIARFLLKFEKDGISKKSADLRAKEDIPYSSDPENRVLLEWCSKNGFVDFEVRNKRFGDYSISTQGKLFLMQQRSNSRRLKYWIEDHPFAWSCVMVVVGWMGSEAMKLTGKFIHS
jgi:hypothetical protein